MSLMDPYSPCFCGSGQKYKWCCQKVESQLERSARLEESGQLESAIKTLDEGLLKAPDSPGLLIRKAIVLSKLERFDLARKVAEELTARQPKNPLGAILLVRSVLLEEGPVEAAEQYQRSLPALQEMHPAELGELTYTLAGALGQMGFYLAARKHAELALGVAEEAIQREARQLIGEVSRSRRISIWERNRYRLAPAPESASAEFRASFANALKWAESGQLSAAEAAFALLAAGSHAGIWAERNRGICLLWLAREEEALQALRRYIARTPVSADVVELEALCQQLDIVPPGESVDVVQLSWPIRDRDALAAALAGNKGVIAGGKRQVRKDEENSPIGELYHLLTHELGTADAAVTIEDLPDVEGVLIVAGDTLVLEAHDDGRLDRLTDRVVSLAGRAIPPAHPRTKVVARDQKYMVKLQRPICIPPGVDRATRRRLQAEASAHSFRTLWFDTPHPSLDWRTPREAGTLPELRVALRAAMLMMEASEEPWTELVDFAAIRRDHGIEPEPTIDPATFDPASAHICRLILAPIEQLGDDALVLTLRLGMEYGLRSVLRRAARMLVDRPDVVEKHKIDPVVLYMILGRDAASQGDRAQADEWLARGREWDRSRRTRDPLAWEFLELDIRMVDEPAEQWVPFLAGLLERCRPDQRLNTRMLGKLVEIGLVEARPDPGGTGRITLDIATLEALLAQFGPRITTADGRLGAADAGERLWTPESQVGAGAAIWTPDQGAPAGEKPRLILPGQ